MGRELSTTASRCDAVTQTVDFVADYVHLVDAMRTTPVKLLKSKELALAVLVGLLCLSGCDNVGDQLCPVGTNPDDLEDQCPYGPPNPPKNTSDTCPSIELLDPADPQCMTDDGMGGQVAINFTQHIWPALLTAGTCSVAGCHGMGGKEPLLYDDATQSYDVLSQYENKASRRLYINSTNPARAWILCNLDPDPNNKEKMPPQGLSAADYDLVKRWAACHQPLTAP